MRKTVTHTFKVKKLTSNSIVEDSLTKTEYL